MDRHDHLVSYFLFYSSAVISQTIVTVSQWPPRLCCTWCSGEKTESERLWSWMQSSETRLRLMILLTSKIPSSAMRYNDWMEDTFGLQRPISWLNGRRTCGHENASLKIVLFPPIFCLTACPIPFGLVAYDVCTIINIEWVLPDTLSTGHDRPNFPMCPVWNYWELWE